MKNFIHTNKDLKVGGGFNWKLVKVMLHEG